MMLDRLSTDTYCVVFEFLTPLAVVATRSCSRALHRGLDERSVWAAATYYCTNLWGVFAGIPTARAATKFNEVYRLAIVRPPERVEEFDDALRNACRRGWLSKARWIVAHGRTRRSFVWDAETGPFEWACYGGHLSVMRWLFAAFSPRIVRNSDSHERLLAMAGAGHLEALRWYVHTMAIPREERSPRGGRALIQRAVARASWGGHLATVQWLVEYFGILRHEVITQKLYAVTILGMACGGGHIPVVQWLVDEYVLDWADVVPHATVWPSTSQGRATIAQWLAARFGRPTGTQ
jgi:hypothetical protein